MRQNCPGMMAAARLDIPCICFQESMEAWSYLMTESDHRGQSFGDVSAKNYRRRVYFVEDLSCPTCGSCSYLGTANTMCSLSEAGMTVPMAALFCDIRQADWLSSCCWTYRHKIMELVEKHITARQIITDGGIRMIKICLWRWASTSSHAFNGHCQWSRTWYRCIKEFDELSRRHRN